MSEKNLNFGQGQGFVKAGEGSMSVDDYTRTLKVPKETAARRWKETLPAIMLIKR